MSVYIENETDEEIGFSYEELLIRVVETVLEQEGCPYEAEVSITLVDASVIQQLNKEHREIDKVTDVLSFPMLSYEAPGDFSCVREENPMHFHPDTGELLLGDIVICLSRAKEQAREYGHALQRELAFLTAHSMLHLCGYDHIQDKERIQMEKKQEDVLQFLGIGR